MGGCYTAASDLYQVGRMLERALESYPKYESEQARSLLELLLSKQATVEQVLRHEWLPPDQVRLFIGTLCGLHPADSCTPPPVVVCVVAAGPQPIRAPQGVGWARAAPGSGLSPHQRL